MSDARKTANNLQFSVHHSYFSHLFHILLLLVFSLTVKAATLIFISGRGSAFSSAKEGKSDCSYVSSLIWVHNVCLYAYAK